eukprot:3934071-Rhodomonas_salina.1
MLHRTCSSHTWRFFRLRGNPSMSRWDADGCVRRYEDPFVDTLGYQSPLHGAGFSFAAKQVADTNVFPPQRLLDTLTLRAFPCRWPAKNKKDLLVH